MADDTNASVEATEIASVAPAVAGTRKRKTGKVYVTVLRLSHRGKLFPPGMEVKLTDSEAEHFIKLGAVKVKE